MIRRLALFAVAAMVLLGSFRPLAGAPAPLLKILKLLNLLPLPLPVPVAKDPPVSAQLPPPSSPSPCPPPPPPPPPPPCAAPCCAAPCPPPPPPPPPPCCSSCCSSCCPAPEDPEDAVASEDARTQRCVQLAAPNLLVAGTYIHVAKTDACTAKGMDAIAAGTDPPAASKIIADCMDGSDFPAFLAPTVSDFKDCIQRALA